MYSVYIYMYKIVFTYLCVYIGKYFYCVILKIPKESQN